MDRHFQPADSPELLDPEFWRTPRRLSRDDLWFQTGRLRARNLHTHSDEAEEDDR